MPGDRAAGAGLREVDEVVVLDLAGRHDLAGAVGHGKQTRTEAPSGSGSGSSRKIPPAETLRAMQ